MQVVVRNFVKAYNERFGRAVMLTSHYMDDVAALCPRVDRDRQGQADLRRTLAELVHRVRPDKRLQLRNRQVRQMTRLVDDLLEVSRITTGKLEKCAGASGTGRGH